MISFGTDINVKAGTSNCFGKYDIPDLVVDITINDILDNGQMIIEEKIVSGLVQGANYNIKLETDVSGFDGVLFKHSVIKDDTFRVEIINQSGNDGIVIPILKYNIYKL